MTAITAMKKEQKEKKTKKTIFEYIPSVLGEVDGGIEQRTNCKQIQNSF